MAGLARMHNVAEQQVHRLKSEHAGMAASVMKRIKLRARKTCACSA